MKVVITERFDVEHEIGAGGMGTVFRARDREGGGVVALKVLRRGSSGDSQRFDREARVLADLSHPAIVRYVAHGLTTKGDPYLAMEWLEGEDLASRLARGREVPDEAMTPRHVVRLGALVGDALGAAHAQGIIHRDIKPSNLFLPGGDIYRVKLLDFGVARWSRATKAAPTVTGTVLGTPAYMSPEQARGDKRLGPEADVFSLGCVLFECLTGTAPYAGENLMATLGKLILGDPPRIKDFRADIHPAVAAAIEQMMDKSPKRRPPNGHEVKRALSALPDEALGGAEPAAQAGAPTFARSEEPPAQGKPLSGVVLAGGGDPEAAPSSKRPVKSRRSGGFASAVDAASKKPDGAATICDEVVGILTKYIPMPWAMLKAQCQRLNLDPSNLSVDDVRALREALVAAASRFAAPADRAALRDDLARIEERRRALKA